MIRLKNVPTDFEWVAFNSLRSKYFAPRHAFPRETWLKVKVEMSNGREVLAVYRKIDGGFGILYHPQALQFTRDDWSFDRILNPWVLDQMNRGIRKGTMEGPPLFPLNERIATTELHNPTSGTLGTFGIRRIHVHLRKGHKERILALEAGR